MAYTRWNPFREMEELLERYGRSTGKALEHSNGKALSHSTGNELETGDWTPSVDIGETANAFFIKAELPGVDKKDISVSLDDCVLTIKGEKKIEKRDEKNHRVECSYGSFVRSFTLPKGVASSDIQASCENGILQLEIPKKEEVKPKQIAIEVK